MSKVKYPSLNGLRAISILIVVFSHLKEHLEHNEIFSTIFHYVPILTDGQFGVNVFFVISGFLITNLLIREEDNYGEISLRKFYIRRILRIFPAYYFMLLVYFVLTKLNYFEISSESWFTALTYLKYFNWRSDFVTAHAWSLSIEEHFYLMWPFIFLLGKRSCKYFLFAIVIISPLFRIYSAINFVTWLDELTIFQRLDSIAIGCLVAIYQKDIMRYFDKYKNVAFYLAFVWLFFSPLLGYYSNIYSLRLGAILLPLGGAIGTITSISIVSIMLYSVMHTKGVWFKVLNTRVMEQLGVLSYSIYLWQQLFTSDLSFAGQLFPYNLAFILIAALFSYYIIEKPFLKLKGRFSV